MDNLLDDIGYQAPKDAQKHLVNIYKYIGAVVFLGVPAVLIMTFTKNAKEFSGMIGTSENVAFVSVIGLFLVGLISLMIVVYKLLRYYITKRQNDLK